HFLCLGSAHHRQRGGAVRQCRRGTGGDGAAARIEYRLQRGHAFDVGFRTDHFVDLTQHLVAVGVVAFDRHDFIFPAALLRRFPGFLVRAYAELVLLLAADAVHAAEHFGGQAHHVGGLGGVLAGFRVQVDAVHHADVAHVLHTTDHEHITVAGHDALGGNVQ